MSGIKANSMMKRITDIAMSVLLLCLMAYQVTGEAAHEWHGMAMTVLVVIHQILNRKWYSTLFKGKQNPYRTSTEILNILLLMSFALTAFCGMSMSSYAVPFLYGMAPVSFVRRMHLSMSHWSFVLMGLHLGMHMPIIAASLNLKERTKSVLACISVCIGGAGLWLFLRNGMCDYLFFRVPFAFLDYDKAGWLVFLENLLMLVFWVLTGTEMYHIIRNTSLGTDQKKKRFMPYVSAAVSILIGSLMTFIIPSAETQGTFGNSGWASESQDRTQNEQQTEPAETRKTDSEGTAGNTEIQDGFVFVEGGSFSMGSPESENWRIDDETLHDVSVSSFYIDPYETTQAEYERLTGHNPSSFDGEDLPVENLTWLEAVEFANAKSTDAGLTPAYTISEEGVTWDLSAGGYRLPSEAEWEYACRAGTAAPFNTEKSLSADEANFYGHYPYEIEENYFDNSVLEARPGEYRQTTTAVGSFEPNAWGLYDMHGNVNEWCWDYYAAYDLNQTDNPTGAESGTRHVYRGGGWNDFAKNMRSAYRAAGPEDMHSFNLGIRLVRNAEICRTGRVSTGKAEVKTDNDGKVLIAYFSWGGNTRGIAEEIQSQTGADLFEITPVHPYSADYNTVLMEAQEDQHRQTRPELSDHISSFNEYDIILLGYPNWWASIPMPVASFLE